MLNDLWNGPCRHLQDEWLLNDFMTLENHNMFKCFEGTWASNLVLGVFWAISANLKVISIKECKFCSWLQEGICVSKQWFYFSIIGGLLLGSLGFSFWPQNESPKNYSWWNTSSHFCTVVFDLETRTPGQIVLAGRWDVRIEKYEFAYNGDGLRNEIIRDGWFDDQYNF